jgi:hypothetical protein
MKTKFVLLALVLGILTYTLLWNLSFGQRFVAGMTVFVGSKLLLVTLPIIVVYFSLLDFLI